MKTLPNCLFEEFNSFLYAPNAPHYDTELLEPSFSGSKLVIESKRGYERESEVTEQEHVPAVPYVCSPHLPTYDVCGRKLTYADVSR